MPEGLEMWRLGEASECSADDCEFVALAKRLRIPLVTVDREVLLNFPGIAVPLGRPRTEPCPLRPAGGHVVPGYARDSAAIALGVEDFDGDAKSPGHDAAA